MSRFLLLTDSLDNVLKDSIRYKWFRKLSKEEFQGSCYHMDVFPLWVFQVHMVHWATIKKKMSLGVDKKEQRKIERKKII